MELEDNRYKIYYNRLIEFDEYLDKLKSESMLSNPLLRQSVTTLGTSFIKTYEEQVPEEMRMNFRFNVQNLKNKLERISSQS